MPNLQSFAVLDQRIKKYQSDYALQTHGVAFIWVTLEAILVLNNTEIDEALVDEGMDGGIDAIHIDGRDVHIFTCTYGSTFRNASKKFPQNKLDSLIVTIQKIFTKQLTDKDVNPALWEKVRGIWNILESQIPILHFYVCSNKERPDTSSIRRFEDALRQYYFVDFKYLNLEDIVSLILQRRHPPVNADVNFIGRCHFMKSDGPLKATVATVPAIDLIKLISAPDDPSVINEHVFNENVRVDLGLRNPINRGIYDSALSNQNYEFWYLNNGITMVCEKCEYVPNSVSPIANLTNVQIVNGGQTARTLFHAYSVSSEKVRSIDLLVRIIETQDRSISERISETANRQTPVRTRDLHANDWIQRKLEEEFLTCGYYYERKKNQFADKPVAQRLDSEVLGQVALAYYLDMPSEAQNSKSMVFDEKYKDIFNEDSVTASKLLLPMQLFRPIDLEKKDIQQRKRKKMPLPNNKAFIPYAKFHILNTMKLVAEAENLDLTEEPQASKARAKAIGLIWKVIKKEIRNQGDSYTHDRFFKERQTNKTIRDYILKTYKK